MVTEVLLAEDVEVSFGQIYLTNFDMEPPNPEFAFAGQQNGLCGAATEGALLLRTGLQHGTVRFSVELRSRRPDFGSEWEEIVEAAFVCGAGPLVLWGPDTDSYEVNLSAGRYGVTYCAEGMAAAWAAESSGEGAPLDRYLLAVWPAEEVPESERIVRQTSEIARYWHADGRPGVEQGSSTGGGEWDATVVAQRVAELRLDLDVIHGLSPNLAQALARSSADLQRSVARWAALQALSIANLVDDASLRPVVALLETGEAVPPPFDDEAEAVAAVADRVGRTRVRRVRGMSTDDGEWAVREWAALVAVSLTAASDPLEAAVGAVIQAAIAFGADDVSVLLLALRESYPELRS